MRVDWSWLPKQREFFLFEPRGRISQEAFLGGWGSGKTTIVMRKALKVALMNPWRPVYGSGNPVGIISSPTFRTLKHGTLAAFDKVFPPGLIAARRGTPHNDILLTNGFRFICYSGEAEIEGVTACMVVIDEVQHNVYASNIQRYLNMVARIRDPDSPRQALLVSGLPESGWVRETFDQQGDDRITCLASMRDNTFLPEESKRTFLENCPSGQESILIEGKWMPPQHAVYPQFDSSIHLVDHEPDMRVPVHIGLDVGNYGAILVAQPRDVMVLGIACSDRGQGLEIVDEILTENMSVEQMAYELRTKRQWVVRPGASVISVDPTIRRDELAALRKHFPGVRVVKRERGDEHFPIETGIRVTQRALKDALGNVRLVFNRRIAANKLGVVEGVQRYKRNPRTQEAIKDNLRDHCLDALRYLCCTHLQAESGGKFGFKDW